MRQAVRVVVAQHAPVVARVKERVDVRQTVPSDHLLTARIGPRPHLESELSAAADANTPPFVYTGLKREQLLRTGSVVLHELILYQRLRVYSLWQQAGVVFMLVGINQLICQWVQNLEGMSALPLLFLLPAFSSALLWPLVLHILRGLRRHYRVS